MDWRGVGGSDRTPFPMGAGVEESEGWFTEAIEAWRETMGISRFIFVGHSLGALIALSYAMRLSSPNLAQTPLSSA